jgi:hypothetical protein
VKVSGAERYGRPCPALHARASSDGARFSLPSAQTKTTRAVKQLDVYTGGNRKAGTRSRGSYYDKYGVLGCERERESHAFRRDMSPPSSVQPFSPRVIHLHHIIQQP